MLNHTELTQVVSQMAPLLEGSIIQKVFEDRDGGFVLRARRPGQTLLLLLSLDPAHGRLNWIDQKPKQPSTPRAMTMALRKWVGGMVIRSVHLSEHDRVLTLRGDTSDPDWDEAEGTRPNRRPVALIVEWTGALTNLFLVEGEQDKIIYHLHEDHHARGLRTGRFYQLPEPPPAREMSTRWPAGTEDLSAWVDEHFTKQADDERWSTLYKDTAKRLKQHHKKLKRLIRNIEGDLDNAHEAQSLKVWGELLQGAYQDYKRGMSSMTVTNYYDPELKSVEIPLDPASSLQENIAGYFKRYKRLHGAVDDIETRLLEVMTLADEVEAAREHLSTLKTIEALEESIDAWMSSGVLKPVYKQPPPGSKNTPGQTPYRTFVSSRGTTILVGRGSKGNDHLTTKVARGRDIWLHARDWAGAHVVVRVDKNSHAHDADVFEAAMLAAHYSKGKHDSLIDVTFTQAKHVRKPKGYPPGMVTVAGGSTLAIQIDEGALKALMNRSQSA